MIITNTIVYSYGVLSLPAESLALLESEISGGHRYYNRLIEIERAHLDRKAALRRHYLSGLPEAEAAIVALQAEVDQTRAAIKARNAQTHKRTASDTDRQTLAVLRERLSEAKQVRRGIMLAVRENAAYTEALAHAHAELLVVKRAAYAAATCGWGTRLKAAQAVEGALTITNLDGSRRARSPEEPPRFRRWSGDGLAAVQLQNGLAVADLLAGTDPRLCLRRISAKRAVVLMRLGVGPERRPILLSERLTYHQPLPPDGVVTWACLVRRRGPERRMAGGAWKPWDSYQLQLTVRTGREKPCAGSGHAGVDLGWRLMEDGRLRVAFWHGDRPLVVPEALKPYVVLSDNAGAAAEKTATMPTDSFATGLGCDNAGAAAEKTATRCCAGELRIDPDPWRKVHDLQSIRDGHRVDLQQLLIAWLARTEGLPEWVRLATEAIALWRSPRRFCRLADLWQANAAQLPLPPGNDMISVLLRQYREREAHLWQWQSCQEQKNRRRRLGIYRQFAALLARHYRLLAVEDCDWRALNRLPETETNESVNTMARQHLRMAAVGELRQCLKHSGAQVVFSETANTTRQCHGCGKLCAWNQAIELVHTCEHCGETWDEDLNAALNLLARAKTMVQSMATARDPQDDGGSGVAASQPSAGGRWQRRKASRSQNGTSVRKNPAP